MNRPLTLRQEPVDTRRDMAMRVMTIRAGTIDDATRSVECVMTTDSPVAVWDWERGIIDEVLLSDGGQFPDQMPCLANHERYSLDCVIGAVRNATRSGSQWTGKIFFADKDQEADKAWNKVRQKILTDVSIGYRATDYEDIAPGKTQNINGRNWTAGSRWLRISKRWYAAELSVVPIGADQQAKIRGRDSSRSEFQRPDNSGKDNFMITQLRKYLESLGLRGDATDEQAKAFLAALGGTQRSKADAILAGTMTIEQAIRGGGDSVDGSDSEDSVEGDGGGDSVDGSDSEDSVEGDAGTRAGRPARTPEQAIARERQRSAKIRELGRQDVPAELVTRAIDEGWPVSRASMEFLKAIRNGRSPSVRADNGALPVVQVGQDAGRDHRQLAMAFGLLGRNSINIERYAMREGITEWKNIAGVANRDFSKARRLMDFVRACAANDGVRVTLDDERTIRAAVSGGSLASVFTTSINASVLQAWEETTDTTDGWVEEEDVADFKQQTVIDYLGHAGLAKLPRGRSAEHAYSEDSEIDYKIARYAKQFVIDEQDIIDDRFSVFTRMPSDMGIAAKRLRPDLVYAILLANASMLGGALFNSTALSTTGGHANLTTGAMTSANIKAAIQLMGKQYILEGNKKKILNISPAFMLVPQGGQFTAKELLSSTSIIIAGTAGSVTDRGTNNVLENIVQLRVDERLSTGVEDPDSGNVYTGTDSNYFLVSRPGRTIKVAYLRGTNRAPQIRSFILDKGQWGIGWDINHNIGAKAVDFRGMVKSTGA